jgi:hypothetical protein
VSFSSLAVPVQVRVNELVDLAVNLDKLHAESDHHAKLQVAITKVFGELRRGVLSS